MNFLSIDCSTDISSLFLKTQTKTFSKILQSDKYSNDLLMIQILDFFRKNQVGFEDISEILVNQGPGNFSGLRGSLATAKGICLSTKLKLSGYNTFLWACSNFFDKKDSIYSLVHFRDKYFIKKFNKKLIAASKETEVTEEEIIKNYENKFKVIAKSAIKYFDKKILKLSNLSIVDLDHNQLEFLKSKDLLDSNSIKPLYLS